MKNLFLGLLLALSTQVQAGQISVQIENIPTQTEDYLYYDFGTVFVNSRTSVRYTVTNTGVTPLTFSDSYVYGSDYRADHSCYGVLVPGGRCQFEIVFWPYFEGFSSGRFVLNFFENDNITVDLRGEARRM